MKGVYKAAGIASILQAVVLVVGNLIFFPFFFEASRNLSNFYGAGFRTLELVFGVVALIGFITIGQRTKHKFLTVWSFVMVIWGILQLYGEIGRYFVFEVAAVSNVLFGVTGIMAVVFGLAIMTLKDKLHKRAETLSVLYMVLGAGFILSAILRGASPEIGFVIFLLSSLIMVGTLIYQAMFFMAHATSKKA